MPGTKMIQYVTNTTGTTITATDISDDLQIIHEDAIPTLTLSLVFPTTPRDGQRLGFVSVNGVTSLTMSTPVGSIIRLLTSLLAGVGKSYIFVLSQNKWYPTS